MARPLNEGLGCEEFPKWNPRAVTKRKLEIGTLKERYRVLRNSSSGFIQRTDVRDYIFGKYGCKCYICNSVKDLQIDHINSVWSVIYKGFPVELLNQEENLRPICAKCNQRKSPCGGG